MPPVLLGIPWPALRGPLRNHFWKKRRPQPYSGENSGNALEASNAMNYRVWGIPAVLSRKIPGNALRAFPGSFRNFFRKVPAVLGVWPSFLFFCRGPTARLTANHRKALEPAEIGNTYCHTAPKVREAPDTFNFLRHVMRAIWSVRPKCSHRCVSLKETL